MRILYQLVAPLDVVVGPEEPARRAAFLHRHGDPRTIFDVRTPRRGRQAIESDWDAAIVAPYLIEGLRQAETDGFDAGIIGCFSDPALDAAREAVGMPVIGPGAAAVHLALQLGDRIGIISPGVGDPGRSRALMRSMGQETRLASARGMGLSVPDLARAEGSALDRIETTARACMEDGADVLILGCMSMAFLDPTPAITARLGIPVVNPVIAALGAAQIIVGHGLSQSRARWPKANDRPILETRLLPTREGEIA
ncbi:MAG: aspartate/glutamate racemase family protein [Jannaschia sp.]